MRKSTRELLSIDQFTPSDSRLEVIGVFNPGVVRLGNEILMLVRVAEAVKDHEKGILFSPRMVPGTRRYEFDRLRVIDKADQRKPIIEGGLCRLSFVSHLEIVRLSADAKTVLSIEKHHDLFPHYEYEEFGIEDPRITQIGDTYYITYVAVSRQMSISTALMSTTDFKRFRRHGIIFDADTKDVVLFPKEINHKYAALIRPFGNINLRPPAILLAWSPDLLRWGNYQYVLGTREDAWDEARVGAGVPPILTKHGWLNIYHGISKQSSDHIGHYSAGVFLSAPDDPSHVIAQGKTAIFEPEAAFEKTGFVNNVVFPTAAITHLDDPNQLSIFYGGADTSLGIMEVSIDDLLNHALAG